MAGFVGLLVRWHESYLLRPDAGHIPVSNLYEVFILFLVITALMYLYYEGRFAVQKLGGVCLQLYGGRGRICLVVQRFARGTYHSAADSCFAVLVDEIHVPANFIGYGAFCIAAMLGIAELLALRKEDAGKKSWLPQSQVIEEVMYKAIAVGFLFFTIGHHPRRIVGGRRVGPLLELGTRKRLGHSSFG